MATGIIKRLTDRGFGFIAVDGSASSKDLFFHSNELQGVTFEELREGDKLQFEITSGQKGDNATNITRASAEVTKEAVEEAPQEEVEESVESEEAEVE